VALLLTARLVQIGGGGWDLFSKKKLFFWLWLGPAVVEPGEPGVLFPNHFASLMIFATFFSLVIDILESLSQLIHSWSASGIISRSAGVSTPPLSLKAMASHFECKASILFGESRVHWTPTQSGLSFAIRMSGPVEMYERGSCPFQLRRMVSLLFSTFCQFLVSQSTPVPQKIVELHGYSSIYGQSPAVREENISMKAGGVKH